MTTESKPVEASASASGRKTWVAPKLEQIDFSATAGGQSPGPEGNLPFFILTAS